MASPKPTDPELAAFFAAGNAARRAAAATMALETLAKTPDMLGAVRPAWPLWPVHLRDHYFPSRRGGYNAYVSNPVDVAALGKVERRILELLCVVHPDGASYANAGLPPDVRSRCRLLGLLPPGIMEERVACPELGKGIHPRWRILKLALDTYGRKYAQKTDQPPTQEWIAERYFTLPPAGWLELWTEVEARSYGIITAWNDPFAGALAAVTTAERRAWAARWLGELECARDIALRMLVGSLVVDSYRAAKEPVPPRLASLMAAKAKPIAKPKRASPPVKKPRPGKYVFSGKNQGEADIAKLSPAAKKQFLVAAASYAGKSFKTAKAFFAWERSELDEGDGVDVKRWTIAIAKGKPLYDMWTFLVDNGTVFPAGSATPSGVQMIQGSFLAKDKKPASRALAEELQADVPF